jgi:hypothetical protein
MTFRHHIKTYAHNSHTFIKVLQKTMLFTAIRIGLMFEASNYLS